MFGPLAIFFMFKRRQKKNEKTGIRIPRVAGCPAVFRTVCYPPPSRQSIPIFISLSFGGNGSLGYYVYLYHRNDDFDTSDRPFRPNGDKVNQPGPDD